MRSGGAEALDALRDADRFRFANQLEAWIEVEDGRITGSGYGGPVGAESARPRCRLGRKLDVRGRSAAGPPARARGRRRLGPLQPDRRRAHRRPGAPAREPPALRAVHAPRWPGPPCRSPSTPTDGSEHELAGAQPVPPPLGLRRGRQARRTRSGLVDFKEWYRHAFGKHTPWGDEDSPALVTEVETALERELSASHDAGRPEAGDPQAHGGHGAVPAGRPGRRAVPPPRRGRLGRRSTATRSPSSAPARCSASGPCSRAGCRTSTLTAVAPPCKVAVARGGRDRPGEVLVELSERPPARGELSLCGSGSCGVRGSTPAPGPEFVRYGGNTSCVAVGHAGGPPSIVLDAGTGIRSLGTLLGGQPVRRRRPPRPPPLGPHPGPAVLAGARLTPRPRSTCTCRPRVIPLEVLGRAMSPPHFPIRPATCAARGRSPPSSPAVTTSPASRCWPSRSRTKADAPSATASPHPAPARRSPTCPTTGPSPSVPVRTGSASTTPRLLALSHRRRRRSSTTRSTRPRSCPLARTSGTRPSSTPWSSAAAAGAVRAALPPRPQPDRRRDRRAHRAVRVAHATRLRRL